MGILDSLKNIARPYDDSDMFMDEEEFAVDEMDELDVTPSPMQAGRPAQAAAPGVASPVSSSASAFAAQRDNRVVNINATAQLQVVIVKPENMEPATEIADHLREKRTVVMNLEKADRENARRLLDFLSGVAYALDGKLQKVSVNTIIITPYNVGLVGDLIDELENKGLYL